MAVPAKNALSGDVRRVTLALAGPSMGAMLATGAGTLLDALLLARRGSGATAAVALCFPILTMIQAVGFTMGMGAGSAVSRMLGADDTARAGDVATQGMLTAVVLAAALCLPAFMLAGPLLALLAGEGGVPEGALPYARCLLAAGPVMCASLVLSSLLRAQGMTLANLGAFSLGAVCGCGVLAALLWATDMGAQAAGIAMLVREGATLAALVVYIWKKQPGVRPSVMPGKPSLSIYKEIMRSGLPTLLRQGLFAVSGAMVTSCAARFGREALSGVGLAVRAGALLSSGIIGFGQGFAPVCGVCYGAGDMNRVRQAYAFCMRVLAVSLTVIGAGTAVLARRVLLAFGAGEQVASIGAAALLVQGIALPMQGAVVLCGMLTQAMGMTVRAGITGASRQGYVLIVLLAILPRMFGLAGLIAAQGVSDAISLGICLLVTKSIWPNDRKRAAAIGFYDG